MKQYVKRMNKIGVLVSVKAQVKKSTHPALWHTIKRRVSRKERHKPLLSVIIPVYGVEKYIATCLDSIISQTYLNLEIIIIDDESPDRSYQIAREYARWDKRIKIVRKKNGGLGAARNTGIEHSTGDFIAFADSDDTVPEDAYEQMMGALMKSGSDFVVGNVMRVDGTKRWIPGWAKDIHKVDRFGIKFTDHPDIMFNVFAWNKVFKRSFFINEVKGFPEKIRYEDQEPSLRAYLNARRFDVLSHVVYNWYFRDDGTSISQQKAKIEDVADRLKVMNDINKMLVNKNVPITVRENWLIKALGFDLRQYFDMVPRRNAEYWKILREGIRKLTKNLDDSFLLNLDIHDRSLLWAARYGAYEDVLAIDTYLDVYGRPYRVHIDEGDYHADVKYIAQLEKPLPKNLRIINEELLNLESTIYEVRFHGDKVFIKGSVFIDELEDKENTRKFNLELVSLNEKHIIKPKNVKYGLDISVYDSGKNRFVDHSKSGFEASVDLGDLQENEYFISIKYGQLEGFIEKHAFDTQVAYPYKSKKVDGRSFTYELRYLPEKNQALFIITASPLNTKSPLDKWRKRIVHAEVEDVSYDKKKNTLRVAGVYKGHFKRKPIFLFKNDATSLVPHVSKILGGKFDLIFELGNGNIISTGSWPLQMRFLEASGEIKELRVPISEKINMILPMQIMHDDQSIRLSRTPLAAALYLSISPFAAEEQGKYNRQKLEDNYYLTVNRNNLDNEAYLFETFGGTRVDDSPLFISEEIKRRNPSARLYWSVIDNSVDVPDGMHAVVRYSALWYQLLATSKYLINNNNFPYFFQKGENQVYLQTWHGTPLKKIGNDVPSLNLSLGYRELMKKEAKQWDYLLAQNKFSEEVLPRSFGYTGKVIVAGYPRNDNLVNTSKKEVEHIRKKLGIKRGSKVILYAPTWRDNAKNRSGGYKLVNYLDTKKMGSELSGYTILLRGHPNTLKSNTGVEGLGSIIDVRNHQKINDLYKVADFLITDYSSVMFDYAITKKPMIFLAPDIDEYANSTRGFYLDFKTIAPGPIVSTTEEVIELIVKDDFSDFADRYKKFVLQFCDKDDGRASSRVFESVFNDK